MHENPNSTSTVPIPRVRQLAVTSAGKPPAAATIRSHGSQYSLTTPIACAYDDGPFFRFVFFSTYSFHFARSLRALSVQSDDAL